MYTVDINGGYSVNQNNVLVLQYITNYVLTSAFLESVIKLVKNLVLWLLFSPYIKPVQQRQIKKALVHNIAIALLSSFSAADA